MIDLKKIGIKRIITTIFVVSGIVAFMVFSGAIKLGSNKGTVSGNIVVWGTIPYNVMQPYIDQATSKNIDVSYKIKDPITYESDLINAFASGNGPDLFIMPHENILRNADKVFEIPYASFPKTQYESTYINEARIFLTDTGILAIPMSVDPLVMYYNKPLIASSFLIGAPKYWDELLDFVSGITVSDSNGYISISGVAMGTYENISNAKSLLSTILIQNGNLIVGIDKLTGQKKSYFTYTDDVIDKSKQALNFYLSFSRKGNKNYSWNEAVNNSREKFISGELALYFGKASEINIIRKKNPNLDFDVTIVPQIDGTSIRSTFGSMTAVAISKHTKNIAAAINTASKLSGKDISSGLTKDLSVAPVRYDLLRNKPDDAYLTTFYNSAIMAKAWIDSDYDATDMLFKNLVRSVNSGSLSLGEALHRANSDLDAILNRTINTTIKNRITEVDNNV